MRAIEAIAARHHLAIVEDAAPGAPGHRRRPPGRHDRRRRRLQLLPDEEPRRARRRRRGAHARRAARGARQAPAQRRPDHALSPRGARRQQPARRNAGGDPARAAAVPAGVDREAPRHRRALSRGARRARSCACRREFDAGHVYHLFPVLTDARDRFQAHMKRTGHRDADSLPGADSRASRRCSRPARPCARSPTACARKSCRCRCIRRLSDAAVAAVAEAAATFGAVIARLTKEPL